MDSSSKIAELLRGITGTDRKRPVFLTMVVSSVNGDTCSAKIGDFEVPDIRLSVIKEGAAKGILVTPSAGSVVLVADLSGGEMRNMAVIGFTDIDSVDLNIKGTEVHIDEKSIRINGGNNGGLVSLKPLSDNLESLRSYVETLQKMTATALAPLVSLDGGASVTAYNSTFNAVKAKMTIADMEDDKVTH